MGNKLVVVKLHSFVDLTTNSSSELFVCNNQKTQKKIEDILRMFKPFSFDVYSGVEGLKQLIIDQELGYQGIPKLINSILPENIEVYGLPVYKNYQEYYEAGGCNAYYVELDKFLIKRKEIIEQFVKNLICFKIYNPTEDDKDSIEGLVDACFHCYFG